MLAHGSFSTNSFHCILKMLVVYITRLVKDLAWDCISETYLIKYAHNGRLCDLRIVDILEVNSLITAFKAGM